MKKLDLISEIPEQLYFFNEEALKELNKKGNYELFAVEKYLGYVENVNEKINISVENNFFSNARWETDQIFDKIIKNVETNNISIQYFPCFGKHIGEYDKVKKEIKFVFESSVDFVTDRDELFTQFYYERNKVHNKLFESAEIETLCFEKQNTSGYKISSVEKKIGNSNMITDFVIETANGLFEFHENNSKVQQSGELTFKEALLLKDLFSDYKGKFIEIVTKKEREFNDKIEKIDYDSFSLKEFKTEEAPEILKGILALDELEIYPSPDGIETKTLNNALTVAKEIQFCDVFYNDKESQLILATKMNLKMKKPELKITLLNEEKIMDMAEVYNKLKNEKEFEKFNGYPIEITSDEGTMKISADRNEIKYKGNPEIFYSEDMLKEAKEKMEIKNVEKEIESGTKKNTKVR